MAKYFGTDGIRGKANTELTPELCLKIGRALGAFLSQKSRPVLIARDTRVSGYMLEDALAAGLNSAGKDVVKGGVLPTPAAAYLTRKKNFSCGIVISASHNPYFDNGVKVFNSKGMKISEVEEEKIEKLIDSKKLLFPSLKVGKTGYDFDLRRDYIDFLKKTFKNLDLKGMRISVDCSNGAASKITPELLKGFNAEVSAYACEPDGFNINKNCGSLYLNKLRNFVLKNKSHIGIAHDGDADRTLFISPSGKEVDGDYIMALIGIYMKKKGLLQKNTIAGTVMSNMGFENFCSARGIKLLRAAVGDKYVLDEMLKKGLLLGGEQSGHIINLKYNTTGDGVLTALTVLKILREEKINLDDVLNLFKKYPQKLVNLRVKIKPPIARLKTLKQEIKKQENFLKDKGRVLIRYSGTENIIRIMAETETEALLNKVMKPLILAAQKELN